ncbi:MAG: hypothetical protein ACRDE2_04895, partial [Chitinophagaceae bacterium]
GNGNPAGPANDQGNQLATIGQDEQNAQDALTKQQNYQQELSSANQLSSWFQNYKQQQAQSEMPQSMPSQAQNYTPPQISHQPTQAETWLNQYV